MANTRSRARNRPSATSGIRGDCSHPAKAAIGCSTTPPAVVRPLEPAPSKVSGQWRLPSHNSRAARTGAEFTSPEIRPAASPSGSESGQAIVLGAGSGSRKRQSSSRSNPLSSGSGSGADAASGCELDQEFIIALGHLFDHAIRAEFPIGMDFCGGAKPKSQSRIAQ